MAVYLDFCPGGPLILTAESRGGSSQSSPAPTSPSGKSPLSVQGCELVAPAGHVVKLCRGLKLGWSVDKSHGRVAWSTVQDRSGVGGASSTLGLAFAFGACSVNGLGWKSEPSWASNNNKTPRQPRPTARPGLASTLLEPERTLAVFTYEYLLIKTPSPRENPTSPFNTKPNNQSINQSSTS